MRLILEHGVPIHDKDGDGTSSISTASIHGHVNVVELLLSKGASMIKIAMILVI